MAVRLPVFKGTDFRWKERHGFAYLERLPVVQFPSRGFYIRSHKSNETQLFLPDNETMEANEFYGGEAYAYFAPGANITVMIKLER